ncbi:MAG: aldehyde dehydrogenase family protein [Pseudomonadota bacterium]|nr:aldehyde dehydrogenase family protein [Pseudomonadota bacterium]
MNTVLKRVENYLSSTRRMLIGGDWVLAKSGETIRVEDPATGQEISQVPAAARIDVDNAVAAARRSFDARIWRGLPPARRAELMWALADLILANTEELARLEVLDNGMPNAFAKATINGAADGLRYYAGLCRQVHGRTANVGADLEFHAFSVAEPVGVVGLITPWNGPIATLCTKLAPALAAGCSIVAKPAELTSLTALRLGELILEAGIPAGVVNIVTGLGHVAGAALAENSDVDKVSFTGSTAVGKSLVVAAAGNLKRVTLELGGKSPVFIFDDADLDVAIPAAAMGIFANSGQVCFAGSRLYVQSGIHDRIVAGIESFAKKLKLGSGLDPATQLGPLISSKQRERVLRYIESGRSDGAELVTGGGACGERGWFVEPTVFTGTTPDMQIVKDEIFGPVLTVMRFDGLQDVARLGNATTYGLGAGIFTRDAGIAHKAARLLDAGNIWVNCYGRLDKQLPFGGFKQSGWGRENGSEGIDAYLEKKAVYFKL